MLPAQKLDVLALDVAIAKFGSHTFPRQLLREAVEQELRNMGAWQPVDDEIGGGVRKTSKGFGSIDWAISRLKKSGLMTSLGRNQWQVASPMPVICPVPTAVDIEPPGRVLAVVSRIIRNTPMVQFLKELYEFRCQVCGIRIEISQGLFYAEVHHIKPLGGSHKGLDVHSNMLVLCPNHHAMFDLGIPRFLSTSRVSVGDSEVDLIIKHEVAEPNIKYHNENVWLGSKSRAAQPG
jgi:hypothetical protein